MTARRRAILKPRDVLPCEPEPFSGRKMYVFVVQDLQASRREYFPSFFSIQSGADV